MHTVAVTHNTYHSVDLCFRFIERLLNVIHMVRNLYIHIRQHAARVLIVNEHTHMKVLCILFGDTVQRVVIRNKPHAHSNYQAPQQESDSNFCR